jgi:plastocyanin
MQAKPVTTRHYVVGADKGLANVFVYIKQGAQKTPATGEGPTLDQTGCMYEPYVMGVVTGQKFKIRNSDSLLHNVHATPKPGGNKEFNFAQVSKGQVNEKAFEAPEVLVRMKCDVHPWMFAYVGVVDHPYFAVTDKDGNFTIKNVPPGKYTVEAIHQKSGPGKTAEVEAGKSVNFEFEVPAS